MVIDSSVIVAILGAAPERGPLLDSLRSGEQLRISAASYVECGLVLDGRALVGVSRRLDLLLESEGIAIQPVSVRQARLARQAHVEYGRGRGHRARLNFGDCFAYALAIDLDEPLLFKGDDFSHTDVRRAEY